MKATTHKRDGAHGDGDSGGMDHGLHELFLDQLADMHNAEQQLTKALPKLARAAESPELRDAFHAHLEQTLNHVIRLEEAAESVGASLKRKKCKAMEGLVEEGVEMMEEQEDSSALDAGLIAAAQKVEHYEIATYGTLRAWAQQMGHSNAAALLDQTLIEEKEADRKLNRIAESMSNVQGGESI